MEIVFTKPKNKMEFIQAPELEKKPQKEPKKEVRFKSNRTNRTDLETIARTRPSQLTANMASGGKKSTAKKQQKQSEKSFTDGSLKSPDQREELILPGFGNGGRPLIPAYVQQRLPPGVRLGNITALNTDQHRFYSFNQRLITRFIPLWGERVRAALYQWIEENNAPAISKTWVTNVEIIMNPKGEIIEVQPFRLSGTWPIDNAAIKSFKQVKNVPNPPKEMVDENGYIHLQFQTEVYWVPQPNMRFQSGN